MKRKVYYRYNPQTLTYDRIYPSRKDRIIVVFRHLISGIVVGIVGLVAVTYFFDTPWDKTQYQPLLDSIQAKHNLPVLAIFTSHWHEDRAGGFDFYNKKGIPTYATAQTNSILKANNKATSTHEIVLNKLQTLDIKATFFVSKFLLKLGSKINTALIFPFLNSDSMAVSLSI